MNVAEWIEWFKKQPPGNKVMLRDPDTNWLLPLLTTPHWADHDEIPQDTTIVYAEY